MQISGKGRRIKYATKSWNPARDHCRWQLRSELVCQLCLFSLWEFLSLQYTCIQTHKQRPHPPASLCDGMPVSGQTYTCTALDTHPSCFRNGNFAFERTSCALTGEMSIDSHSQYDRHRREQCTGFAELSWTDRTELELEFYVLLQVWFRVSFATSVQTRTATRIS